MVARLLRRQRRSAPKRWHAAAILATWFGVGLLPWTPGTWASLAALPLGWLVATQVGPLGLGIAALLLFGVGCWAAGVYEREAGTHDPSAVVIDEVVAQWLLLLLVPPDIVMYLVSFALFRVADIAKPWPASVLDRRLTGGIGIMLDDLIAALYAGVVLLAITYGAG